MIVYMYTDASKGNYILFLFMIEILRTDKLKFSNSLFFTWKTAKNEPLPFSQLNINWKAWKGDWMA